MNALVGSLEAGGTKFVCAVGSGPDDLRDEVRFPTKKPGPTLERTVEYFRKQQKIHGPLQAIGVGCFGPVDLDPKSPRYGHITSTPKQAWKDVDVLGPLRTAFGIPLAFDTDVNAAALAEWRWGAAQGLDTFIYLTFGTGIGGGGMARGRLLHGLVHPEMGHMKLPHDRQRDPFAGLCPFHADCFEGLAAGPAIEARWGQKAETLPIDHPAWELEAHYVSLGLMNLLVTLSPQRIILGGGVMEQKHLFPRIYERLQAHLNGYLQTPALMQHIEKTIVPPELGKHAGVLGGVALAHQMLSG